MLALHDQFTPQMRNRLKFTSIGLGLVQLLQDAGLTEEARSTLAWLEFGFQGVAEESDKPCHRPGKACRLKGVSRPISFVSVGERRRAPGNPLGPQASREMTASHLRAL
jgi:hypothetical protein